MSSTLALLLIGTAPAQFAPAPPVQVIPYPLTIVATGPVTVVRPGGGAPVPYDPRGGRVAGVPQVGEYCCPDPAYGNGNGNGYYPNGNGSDVGLGFQARRGGRDVGLQFNSRQGTPYELPQRSFAPV